MNKQITLPGITDELAQAATKKKEFLSQIDRIIPWNEWLELLKPRYYKGERGNKPYALEKMLRIYLVQNLYDLSDMATTTEVIDSRACARFCGVDSSNRVPDGDTIGRFRALPVEHGLQVKLFAQIHDVTMVPKLLTGEETEVYGVAGIWERKSAGIPSLITSKARRSNTKSTADRPKANIIRLVPWGRFGEENTRNPLSGRK